MMITPAPVAVSFDGRKIVIEGLWTLRHDVVAAGLSDAHGFGRGLTFGPGGAFRPEVDHLGIGGARGAHQ